MMVCSILLDARSVGARLPRRLVALKPLRQRHDLHTEVLVADDTDDPRLLRLANRHDARIVPMEETPLGDRLNTAFTHSQGEALLFPAGWLTIPASWLETAVADIEHHRQDAVVLTASSPNTLKRLWQRLRHQTPADTLCISRIWFERIGGCDPGLDLEALSDLIERLRTCPARIRTVVA